jgi:outer membrane protein W
MMDFYKGMLLLGILADVSFPFGDKDTGFKHIAGTAWSVHAALTYLITKSIMLSLRAGHINFGTQTTEQTDEFFSAKYEDTFSQIPLLLGAYYLFATGSGFKSYIGLALGVFFQSYAVKWSETYNFPGQQPFNLDESFTNTAFGLVPALGFYYILSSIMLHAVVEYAFILSNLPSPEYNGQSEDTDEKAK